jgi:SAM-dependent methyltransferase
VYQTKLPTEVSWYQAYPELSLRLIADTGIVADDPIIDVGAGASTLVDYLIMEGYRDITLLDVAHEALELTRARLGPAAEQVTWLDGDVTAFDLPEHRYALWHDRAVFHFLTDEVARRRYVAQANRAVKPGGHVIIATFALDGPERCSGLDVVRYDSAALPQVFGRNFQLVSSVNETHRTPWGSEQRFTYCCCKRMGGEAVPTAQSDRDTSD